MKLVKSNKKSFIDLDVTKNNLNRKDVFEIIKESFVNKFSNYIAYYKINEHGIIDADIKDFVMRHLVDKLHKMNKDGGIKLSKYNLDFGLDSIHYYHSVLVNKELPIYWNLNFVDGFFQLLKNDLIDGIKENLLKDSITLNKEELKFLSDSIQEYLKPFNITVKQKMLELGLFYANDLDQQNFSDKKYVFKPDISNEESQVVGGVLLKYDKDIGSKWIQCSDEAYNNFIYMTKPGITLNNTDPNNISVNSLKWIKQLGIEAEYLEFEHMEIFLDKKSTDLSKFIEILHIDNKPCFGVSMYDAENQLLIERSTDFSTTESEYSQDITNSQDELCFTFDDITTSDNG